METTLTTDVIIVGAGPTGLSLAIQLMRYNINFVIFDPKEGVTELSKALVVHARTLEIYDQIGLAEKAVAGGERLQKGVLTHDGKVSTRLDFSDFGGQFSPFPFLLIFEQSKNERLLYDYLQQHGQSVQWQTELESLTQDANGVNAVVRTKSGEIQTIKAAYLVGCDGASSPTRHALGLNFCGSTQPRLFYVADVQMEFPGDRNAFNAVMGEDSFVLIVPMQGDNRWRLIGNLPEYESQLDQEILFDAIEAKVKRLTQVSMDITKVHWFSSYKVHTRRAETFSSGRCFLAGDAAHIHTPAGGQGMNTGIQDAYNLAWKLAFVLQGKAQNSLLETYSEERVANAIRLLQTTDQFFDVAASDRWYLRFFRGNILPTLASLVSQFSPAKEFLFPVVSQIALNYEGSSLSQHQQRSKFEVKAGDRMPYFLIEGENIYNQLRAPKFHLLIFSDGQHDNSSLKLDAEYADCVELHVVPLYPRAVEIFGSKQSFQVLLRPDHYIALLSPDCSLNHLTAYFKQAIKL
ncbi:FAD-dependent monooxygenase [Mastigocladopsis repens]|uniref:FAD-dependent monooxygenase n=1 Tax=Mastigocladopsis repens TaxID=221287 RepID=UPI0002D90121|nr:FAD-dependent monooxygenase [Mastigocladopsis repens]